MFTLDLHDLLDYSAWQRQEWKQWFTREGAQALAIGTGPHGDGRFDTVGALIRHIFSAELRYAQRIAGVPVTDTASVSSQSVDALFGLGNASRDELGRLLDPAAAVDWDRPLEFPLLNSMVRLSPRKILLHLLTHELRHWAQVATLLRVAGRKVAPQDLLFSPVLGEPMRL